jgi:DNA-binding response OmpR family regulator
MAHILVVEDDTETAALICAALAAEHHHVVHLANGRMAFDRLVAERFDAATVDRMVPGIDGLTLVARIRARQITTPVLVISALGYFEASDNLINVHIAKLRRKLERPDRAAMIETIKGEGYRLAVS